MVLLTQGAERVNILFSQNGDGRSCCSLYGDQTHDQAGEIFHCLKLRTKTKKCRLFVTQYQIFCSCLSSLSLSGSQGGCTRQSPPLDRLPDHPKVLCEHLWVWNIAQGYLSSVLAPPHATRAPSMFCPPWDLNREPSVSQPSPQ